MFKKYAATLTLIAFTALSAHAGVPIFSSTDNAEDYFQQMELTPTVTQAPVAAKTVSAPLPIKPVAYATDEAIPQNGPNNFVRISNDNFQNAIQNLEGAEVGIREQLVNYKTQYTDANVRYNTVKAERDALRKQVKAYEKQLKDIERTKKNISKNIVGA